MLQLRKLHRAAVARLHADGMLPAGPVADGELAGAADAAIARVRAERARLARIHGGLTRVAAWCDAGLRTDRIEQLDDPGVPEAHKLRLIGDLHRHNRLVGAYRRFVGVLRPLVRAAAARRGGPARLLELASGYGELALALAERADRWGVPVAITGSDIVPAYVDAAAARAGERGLDVRFERIDALDLGGVERGSVDVVLIAQSVHHFTPGQLARMIRASSRAATTAFVAIDGFRGLFLYPLLAGTTRILPSLTHDSFVSARRFYSEPELELIGGLAAGPSAVKVYTAQPGWSVLEVSGQGCRR